MFGIKLVSSVDYQLNHVNYLNNLPFSQELYIEWLINDSSMFLISVDSKDIGHFFVTRDSKIIELFIERKFLHLKDAVFDYIIHAKKIKGSLVKSFDSLLLACCNKSFKKMKAVGCLFRDCNNEKTIQLNDSLNIKSATTTDFSLLFAQKSELYENEKELHDMIKNEQITMFLLNNDLVGCGFLIHIHKAFSFYDVGMWVHPKYRNQGYAKQIIGYLKSVCIKKGNIPVCGCAINNIGSRKALEANGFNTVHHLLEYKF